MVIFVVLAFSQIKSEADNLFSVEWHSTQNECLISRFGEEEYSRTFRQLKKQKQKQKQKLFHFISSCSIGIAFENVS